MVSLFLEGTWLLKELECNLLFHSDSSTQHQPWHIIVLTQGLSDESGTNIIPPCWQSKLTAMPGRVTPKPNLLPECSEQCPGKPGQRRPCAGPSRAWRPLPPARLPCTAQRESVRKERNTWSHGGLETRTEGLGQNYLLKSLASGPLTTTTLPKHWPLMTRGPSKALSSLF